MKFNKLPLLLIYVVSFNLYSCNNTFAIHTSTSLPVFTKTAESIPTQSLPYNSNPSETGCGEFIATMSIKDAEGLSKEEITQKLLGIYLEHFVSSELGSECRLYDFKIEPVKPGQIVAVVNNELKVDYTGIVEFAVKIKEYPSNWVAGNGEDAPDGWIIHKSLIVRIIAVNNQYILKFMGTG